MKLDLIENDNKYFATIGGHTCDKQFLKNFEEI